MKGMTSWSRAALIAEYVLVFLALPLLYVLDWVPLPVIPALWLLAAICLAWLVRAHDFESSRLWDARRLGDRIGLVVLPFLVAAPLLLLITVLVAPERLFGFVRQRPAIWALVMVLYPLLSAYPQGIVYRSFIFHRYRRLFPGRWARIAASAVAFSAVHVVFENWIAPSLSLLGGALFAWTYERTGSALLATLQHALFGCFLFTIGLGWYFYAGSVG
jgi:membrane protease YdiL (CAAX protease family)